jgi:hypothetical protein
LIYQDLRNGVTQIQSTPLILVGALENKANSR